MIDKTKFMDDYSRGMEMLRIGSRSFANLVSSLGYPIPDETIPTAQVQLNMDEKRIEFLINPNFIADLKDSDIAAVIAHETYHVLLDHLSEMADTKTFPKRMVLIDAQECIINDTLPSSVGFETMPGTYKGMERHNQDFSNFTSKEGYDFILKKMQEEEEQKQENSESDEDKEKQESKNDSKQDSDPQDSDGSSEGSDAKDEKSGEENGDGSGSKSDEGEESENGAGSGAGGEGAGDEKIAGEPAEGCHGVAIVGESSDDADAVADVLGQALTDALDNVDMNDLPADIQDALENLSDNGVDVPLPGFSMGTPKDGFNKVDPYSDLNVNWLKLLQQINPKMKNAGKPKYKDSWHAPRRRMLHSYPSVILPTRVRLDDSNKKGDSIPSFVIALDMSGSIPERLLGTLAAFATSIPEHLIKAFPITWSDGHRVFNPERPREMVPRGGTTISTVMDYVRKVEKETGTKPYVLVISDGHYKIPHTWDKSEIMEKWYWMGIQSHDVKNIMSSTGKWTTKERVFDLNDFI